MFKRFKKIKKKSELTLKKTNAANDYLSLIIRDKGIKKYNVLR